MVPVVLPTAAFKISLAEHITVADGLPDATITAICGDDEMVLWIGTNNGLCRYDGNSV